MYEYTSQYEIKESTEEKCFKQMARDERYILSGLGIGGKDDEEVCEA